MSKTSATVFLALAKVGNLLLLVVSVRLFFHWLGQERYGSYLFVQTWIGYLVVFDLGLWIGVQKRLTEATARRDQEVADRMVRLQFLSTWAIGSVSAAALIGVGLWYRHVPHARGVTVPSMELVYYGTIAYLGTYYFASCQYVLAATERFGQIAKLNLLQSVLGTGFAVGLTHADPRPESVGLGMAIGSCLTALAARWVTRPNRTSIRAHAKDLLRDVVPIGIRGYSHRIASLVGRNADRTVIGAINSGQLTLYTVACRIPEVMSDIVTPMVSTTLPQLTRAQNDARRFSALIERNALIAVAIGCSFILMPTAFGHSLLRLWLGVETPGLDTVVLFMGVYRVFELLYASLASPFYATGQVQRLIVFSTFNAVVTAVATYFAYMKAGLVGVGAMNLCIGFSQFLPLLLVVRKLAGQTFAFSRFMSKALGMISASLAVAWAVHLGIDRSLLAGHEKWSLPLVPILCAVWITVLCAARLCPIPDPIARRLPGRLKKETGPGDGTSEDDLSTLVEEVDISAGDLSGAASAPHDFSKPDMG